MIRDLVLYPDDRLRATAYDVNDPDKAAQVARDLLDTLASTNGHGLAAVQIGELVQMFAVDQGEEGGVCVYANPRILATSGSTKTREGCLSIPGVYGVVKRPRKVRVEVTPIVDGVGHERTVIEFKGFTAVVVQHEIDHLNGVLFTDKMIEEV